MDSKRREIEIEIRRECRVNSKGQKHIHELLCVEEWVIVSVDELQVDTRQRGRIAHVARVQRQHHFAPCL